MHGDRVSLGIYPTLKELEGIDEIIRLARRLFIPSLTWAFNRVASWDHDEKYAWALGFSIGDASIDRRNLAIKRVDLETSRLGTITGFLTIFSELTCAPIVIRFYLREHGFSRYKLRACVKVDYETLKKLVPNKPWELENIFDDEKLFRSFLAGLIDSDGSIQPYVKRRGRRRRRLYFEPEVCITDNNVMLLHALRDILNTRYGIHGNVVYGFSGNLYRLRINSKDDVYRLISLISGYMLNVERFPKAKIIECYMKGFIDSINKLKTIIESLNHAQNENKKKLHKLIELMVRNKLIMLTIEGKIAIIPEIKYMRFTNLYNLLERCIIE